MVVPLALPTAIFLAYAQIERRRRQLLEIGEPAPWWVGAPWPWLIGSGIVLALASLFLWALTGGQPRSARYVPAHMEGGRLIGGQTLPGPGPGPGPAE